MTNARTILIALAFAALGGCATKAPTPLDLAPTLAATEGVAAVLAHNASAEQCTTAAKPHADATGKVYLDQASNEHGAVQAAALGTGQSIAKVTTQLEALHQQVTQDTLDRQAFESKLSVRIALGVERALLWGGLALAALGVLSIFLHTNLLSLVWNSIRWVIRL